MKGFFPKNFQFNVINHLHRCNFYRSVYVVEDACHVIKKYRWLYKKCIKYMYIVFYIAFKLCNKVLNLQVNVFLSVIKTVSFPILYRPHTALT